MKKLTLLIIAFVIAVTGMLTLAPVQGSIVHAATTDEMKKGYDAAGGRNQTDNTASLATVIQNIVNVMLYILGAIAVVMIILGGLRYTMSNGDQSAISGAKNTILYAVIGLIVAIMAYAIVNFVIDSFSR